MVAHWVQVPLSVDGQRRCAAGAPGLALWVPHPLRALSSLRNSSGAQLAHWESNLDPPVGIGLLDGQCSCRGGAGVHWVALEGPPVGVGGPGGPWVGCGRWCGVWAGGPLSSICPSGLVCPWWAPPPAAQTAPPRVPWCVCCVSSRSRGIGPIRCGGWGVNGGVGLGWVGLAASCRSRPSGVGFLPCPTTRLNNLTVRFQGRADYRQPPDPTEAQVGGRYRRPVCRRARGQGCGRGLGLACGGQVWPGAPGPVGQAMGA